MTDDSYEVMEFHLSRELPHAGAFGFALSGMFFLFVVINPGAAAPPVLAFLGLLFFFLAAFCFSFRRVVRMDNRSGTIEHTVSTFLWKRSRSYSVADFRGVGIGSARGSSLGVYFAPKTHYFVQLVGRTVVNLPGASNNREAAVDLAETVGGYLNLPVEKKPKVAFF